MLSRRPETRTAEQKDGEADQEEYLHILFKLLELILVHLFKTNVVERHETRPQAVPVEPLTLLVKHTAPRPIDGRGAHLSMTNSRS